MVPISPVVSHLVFLDPLSLHSWATSWAPCLSLCQPPTITLTTTHPRKNCDRLKKAAMIRRVLKNADRWSISWPWFSSSSPHYNLLLAIFTPLTLHLVSTTRATPHWGNGDRANARHTPLAEQLLRYFIAEIYIITHPYQTLLWILSRSLTISSTKIELITEPGRLGYICPSHSAIAFSFISPQLILHLLWLLLRLPSHSTIAFSSFIPPQFMLHLLQLLLRLKIALLPFCHRVLLVHISPGNSCSIHFDSFPASRSLFYSTDLPRTSNLNDPDNLSVALVSIVWFILYFRVIITNLFTCRDSKRQAHSNSLSCTTYNI